MRCADKGTRFYVSLKWGIFGFCLFWSFCSWSWAEQAWRSLSPGIEYQDLQSLLTPWSHVHVFRIQLSKNKLALVSARSKGMNMAFVSELARAHHARLAVNGGFFDKTFRPLGLRIHEGEKINPIKGVSWWSVFYIQNNQAQIVHSRAFVKQENMTFAIQSGPRLLVHGNIPVSLKTGRDERTALGITATGEVLIVATENSPMTTTELAELMRKPPILATEALNLDGGSSTQLYADFPDLKLDLHGFALVADAVVVEG